MPTLEFKGKQFVYSHHLSVPFRELKVVPEKSLPPKGKKPSLDDNLIIHGDNLEALKALLPTHAGKVDCIFIDPPYNTGNEGWCYNDNVRSPLMKEWLKKSANPVDKEDLERHDKWLCMMWPRLSLLRELLSEKGVIFATIDNIEQHRLRLIFDEIFGERCFVAEIAWQKSYSPSNDAGGIDSLHDTIFVYSKTEDFDISLLERSEKQDSAYKNPDNDPRGPWKPGDSTRAEHRDYAFYPIKTPSGKEVWPAEGRSWVFAKEELPRLIEENLLHFGVKGDAKPSIKQFLSEVKQGLTPTSWWPYSEAGHNDQAKKEIKQIIDGIPFQTPKPLKLLNRIISLATNKSSIVLDSFAGSGTTAHAILKANSQDDGNRRFILVECEDYADTLTAERVRRVINGYAFTGNQREEIYSEKITWSIFEKKHQQILDQIQSIENLQAADYDKIKKEIKDGVLTVTGERKFEEKVPGLGGSFTFCTLGEPIDIESLLTGNGLPGFDALARYVFYTATGRSLEKVGKPSPDGFVGETELFRVHLFYQPDKEWLRSNEAALNGDKVDAIARSNSSGKRAIVFAVAKFMSQKELTAKRIEFCQLPYAVHRILGD